jgi:GTP-binding protein
VSGRGELHLSVLIESMRREGFELGVSRPEVIRKEIDGVMQEPFEELVIDCEDQHQGALMEELGQRRAELKNMTPDGKGWVRLEFIVPARGLIGFRSLFLTLTSGSGTLTHVFDHYGPVKDAPAPSQQRRARIHGQGQDPGLRPVQPAGSRTLFVDPNVDVYEGQIIGLHSRGNDLVVNPTKGKQLTNVRASGTDEALTLTPPVRHSLEQALEFIEDDELVEVTPARVSACARSCSWSTSASAHPAPPRADPRSQRCRRCCSGSARPASRLTASRLGKSARVCWFFSGSSRGHAGSGRGATGARAQVSGVCG